MRRHVEQSAKRVPSAPRNKIVAFHHARAAVGRKCPANFDREETGAGSKADSSGWRVYSTQKRAVPEGVRTPRIFSNRRAVLATRVYVSVIITGAGLRLSCAHFGARDGGFLSLSARLDFSAGLGGAAHGASIAKQNSHARRKVDSNFR